MAEIRAQLEQALQMAGGTHDFGRDVVPMLLDGRAQYWAQASAAIVTEIRAFPNFSAVNYWLAGGGLADVIALQGTIDPWALEQGATRATLVGRLGWARVLPRYGWKPIGIAMAKDLRK